MRARVVRWSPTVVTVITDAGVPCDYVATSARRRARHDPVHPPLWLLSMRRAAPTHKVASVPATHFRRADAHEEARLGQMSACFVPIPARRCSGGPPFGSDRFLHWRPASSKHADVASQADAAFPSRCCDGAGCTPTAADIRKTSSVPGADKVGRRSPGDAGCDRCVAHIALGHQGLAIVMGLGAG